MSIVEDVSKALIEKEVSSYVNNFIQKNFSNIDSLTLDRITSEILNDDELNNINDYIFNMLFDDIKNETSSKIYLDDRIKNLLDKIMNLIPPQYHSQVKNAITLIDFNKMYVEILETIRYKFDVELIKFVNFYDVITSDSIISLLSTLIILSLFIIAWKNKSIIDFLHDIGMSLLIVGGIMLVILFACKRLLAILSALTSMQIDLNVFTIISFIFFILGFIMIDIDLKSNRESS